mgnify:CR=1 FL=1
MAKLSSVQKNLNRQKLIEKFSNKRKVLKKKIMDKDASNKIEEKQSDYYSLFALSNNEVDNLILEASSKETFEEAANLVLRNLKNVHEKKFTKKDIRTLLHKLKDNHSLST